MSTSSAVNSQDIKVDNAKYRDFVLSLSAYLLSKTRRIMWYLETLVLSARFQQLLVSKEWGEDSKRYNNRYQLWRQQLKPQIKSNAAVFEFGVASGTATRWWAKQGFNFHEWHGFDTFTGLPSAWSRGGVDVMQAGVFDQSDKLDNVPEIASQFPIVWHKGLISETLIPNRVQVDEKRQTVIFIDVDLYEPTVQILSFFLPHLKSEDLIYFDEAFDPWNEGLAFREILQYIPKFKALGHTGSALLLKIN